MTPFGREVSLFHAEKSWKTFEKTLIPKTKYIEYIVLTSFGAACEFLNLSFMVCEAEIETYVKLH